MFLGKLKMAKTKKSEEKTKLDRKEAEELVKKLSKEGMSPTKIGQTLKDTYGTPSVKAMGFKIKKILRFRMPCLSEAHSPLSDINSPS